MDITKCEGKGCPMKDSCRRFTVEPNFEWQSWFKEEPFIIDDDSFECTMYMGGKSESIMQDLKDITKRER